MLPNSLALPFPVQSSPVRVILVNSFEPLSRLPSSLPPGTEKVPRIVVEFVVLLLFFFLEREIDKKFSDEIEFSSGSMYFLLNHEIKEQQESLE